MTRHTNSLRRVTADKILDELQMFGALTCVQLAGMLASSDGILQPILDTLVARGEVCESKRARRGIEYRLAKTRNRRLLRVERPVDTSVATAPAIAPDLTKQLTGYDAEWRVRAELCRLVR